MSDINRKKMTEGELKAANQQLAAANQQLRASEQQLRAANQQLKASEQQLRAEIHQRQLAEEAVRVSQYKLQAIFNHTFQFIGLMTVDGVLIEVNKTALEFSGIEASSVLNKPFWQGPWWSHSVELQEKIRQAVKKVAGGDFVRFESTHLAKDGTLHYIDFSLKSAKDEKGKVIFLIPEGRDITERKQMEQDRDKILLWQQGVNLLQRSLLGSVLLEEKLKLITDNIVRILDVDFCRIWLIRRGDLCEKGCIHAEAVEEPHICRFRDKCLHLLASSGRYSHTNGKVHRRVPFGCYKIGHIASGEEHKLITNDVPNDLRIHNLEWARELGLVSFAGYQLKVPGGDTLGVLGLFAKHNISFAEDALLDELSNTIAFTIQQGIAEDSLRESYLKLKETQAQLIQAEKLSAIGQLASGVAHEVKNPLAIILQSAEYLIGKVSAEHNDILGMILNNAERADNIVRSLVDFSKITELNITSQDINNLLESSLALTQHSGQFEKIKIVKELKKDLPNVLVDKNKMEQVFVNIFLNAIQAMPEGGKLIIRNYLTEFNVLEEEVGSKNNTFFQAKDKVLVVEVEDTGAGILEKDILRIFEPFFTTKGMAGGSGLGLAVSKNIIDMHKGFIKIISKLGKGTRVIITLKAGG